MNSPTVTAVIPTFNRAPLLRRAVDSVLGQTHPHVRALVCDNASADGTEEMMRGLAAHEPRIDYRRHPENRGALANFQYGYDAAETEYFSFLSDDDVLLPHLYESALAALAKHPAARFACAPAVIYRTRDGSFEVQPARGWSPGPHAAGAAAAQMLEQHFIWTGAVFDIRARAGLGPLPDFPMLDILFMTLAAARFPFVVLPRPGAVFNDTGDNYSFRMPFDDLSSSYQRIADGCAALSHLSAADRAAIRASADRKSAAAARSLFRMAFHQRSWTRVGEAARFLAARGALGSKQRVIAALAERARPLAAAAAVADGALARFRRYRKSGWRSVSAEQLAMLYGRPET